MWRLSAGDNSNYHYINSFILSFNKYMSTVQFVPGTLVGTNTCEHTDKNPVLEEKKNNTNKQ